MPMTDEWVCFKPILEEDAAMHVTAAEKLKYPEFHTSDPKKVSCEHCLEEMRHS